nr:hypothetical protein [uncultured Mucilaginibacter sp.]
MEKGNTGYATHLSQSELPVFFLQLGENTSLFFGHILKQAVLSNGANNVYVLTDTNFDAYRHYNCIDISEYTAGVKEFDKVYRHHSINPYFFEKACFDRWFIINDIVKELGISQFVHADCDVLITQDLKPVYRKFIKDKYDGTMMFFELGENSVTSGHTSFWSAGLINNFCNFVLGNYADRPAFDKVLQDTLTGKFLDNKNVSDMILLDVFRTEIKPHTLNLLSLEPEGISFDFNVNVPFNGCKHYFETTAGTKIKKMYRRKDGLYAKVADKGEEQVYCKFYTLHFQGYLTKTLIPLHASPQNLAEAVKNYAVAKAHNFVRRAKLYKNRVRDRVKEIVRK